jgi:hypothetical protein
MATKTQPLPQLDPLRRYSIADSLTLLGVSKKRFYAHVKAGRITLLKDGRRSFCPGSDIARLSQPPEAA